MYISHTLFIKNFHYQKYRHPNYINKFTSLISPSKYTFDKDELTLNSTLKSSFYSFILFSGIPNFS